ncbi:MAG TPA: hypothetical protein VGI10_15750 [Polyangiaceae bacterium]
MKQWAFTLPLIICVAATTACSSSTKPAPGGAGGGSTGGNADEKLLPIGSTGYMSAPDLGIQGAWYSYGDGVGPDGMTASGDCEKAGHAVTDCSSITTPLFGSFDNDGTGLHTAGTVELVGNTTTGTMMCPTVQTDCDYTAMWGAGIGVDVNNAGNADGGTAMKMPLGAAATTNKIVGVAFDIDQIPLPKLRVEFPMPNTTDSAHVYTPTGGDFHSPLIVGHNRIIFATDLVQPSYVAANMVVPFDPTQLVSIQFHVPTSTSSGPSPYDFKISNFAAIIGQ